MYHLKIIIQYVIIFKYNIVIVNIGPHQLPLLPFALNIRGDVHNIFETDH